MDRAALWARIEESVTQEFLGYIALVGGVDKSKDVESLEEYIDTTRHVACHSGTLWTLIMNTHRPQS